MNPEPSLGNTRHESGVQHVIKCEQMDVFKTDGNTHLLTEYFRKLAKKVYRASWLKLEA